MRNLLLSQKEGEDIVLEPERAQGSGNLVIRPTDLQDQSRID